MSALTTMYLNGKEQSDWDILNNPEGTVYEMRLTKEGALQVPEDRTANYIHNGTELIYLRSKCGAKYDPTNFEESLRGILRF